MLLSCSIILAVCLIDAVAMAQDLQQIGSYPTTASNRIVVNSNYAYVIDNGHLLILDVTDGSSPIFKSDIVIPGGPGRFDIEGEYAFITAEDSGLQIVNIADPMNPSVVSHFYTAAPAKDVKVSGSYAYLLDYAYFRILDISNPLGPVETANMNFYHNNEAIAQGGNYIYLIGWRVESDMLVSIDISDAANPLLSHSVTEEMFCSRLFADGNGLYVVNQPYYFHIWDISTPGNFGYPPGGLYLSGITGIFAGFGFAFATLGRNGLSVIDVSTGDSCAEISRYDTPGYASDIYISGDYIYLTDTDSFLIFRFNPSSIDNSSNLPLTFSLSQNYPNPFNAQTTISYSLPQAGLVTLSIYNIIGQKVATLVDGIQNAGEQKVVWDAKEAASGVYFGRLEYKEITKFERMMLLK